MNTKTKSRGWNEKCFLHLLFNKINHNWKENEKKHKNQIRAENLNQTKQNAEQAN